MLNYEKTLRSRKLLCCKTIGAKIADRKILPGIYEASSENRGQIVRVKESRKSKVAGRAGGGGGGEGLRATKWIPWVPEVFSRYRLTASG